MTITLYYKQNGVTHSTDNRELIQDPASLIWIDLQCPTREEELWTETLYALDVPTREEIHGIELSNRFYQEDGHTFCTASIVTQADTPEPEIHSISFILGERCLITLRYSKPSSFAQFSKQLTGQSGEMQSPTALLFGLSDSIIARFADVIENSGHLLDDLNRTLFRPAIKDKKDRRHSMPDIEDLLREVGVQADLLAKLRESLLSINRMLGFVQSTHRLDPASMHFEQMQVLQKDIPALISQVDALSGRTAFLLDAALGLVGLQQTAIIKIFSVAAVIFLPPTLVASIYGMNFQHMPELDWRLGYPLAIGLMLLSAWLPYRFFKKKKWL